MNLLHIKDPSMSLADLTLLQVSKRSTVMLRGRMVGGLYRLDGSVETGGALVGTHECDAGGGRGYEMIHPTVGTRSRKKRVTFACDLEGGGDLSGHVREVEPRHFAQ